VENEEEDYARVVSTRTGNNGGNKIKLRTGTGRDRDRRRGGKKNKSKRNKKRKKRTGERERESSRRPKRRAMLLFSDKTRRRQGKSFK